MFSLLDSSLRDLFSYICLSSTPPPHFNQIFQYIQVFQKYVSVWLYNVMVLIQSNLKSELWVTLFKLKWCVSYLDYDILINTNFKKWS